MDLIETIAEYYNFDYSVTLSDDVFAFFPNGTIGGSLGEVLQNLLKDKYEYIQCSVIFKLKYI